MKRNIIWIIVDSVRNYACPADRIDDRGRISLMDELAETWIDFRTVVTSAPSTVMSVSAMFTSCPSYYLGANFAGFNLSDCGRPTIGSILKPLGYKTHFITLLPNEREAWDGICDHIPRRLWPKGLTHRAEWSNPTITEVIKNVVADGLEEPFLFYVHYNCRGDEQISENVRNGLKAMEDSGLLENSVVFLTSDHGYPDPFRMAEVERLGKHAALEHRRLPHDLVMTDDNILVPLLIKYPDHTPRRIEDQVSTLDYLPTALELAGITDHPHFAGKSLVPLLEGRLMPEIKERKIRVDGRFLGQSGRATAIRSATRKYIYYHDFPESEREQFYDLTTDRLEIHNLIPSNVKDYEADLEDFRAAFQQEEEKGLAFQRQAIKVKYLDRLRRLFGKKDAELNMKVLYIKANAPGFDKLFIEVLQLVHGDGNITHINLDEIDCAIGKEYDLVEGIIVEGQVNKKLFTAVPKIKARNKLLLDLNVNLIKFSRYYRVSLFLLNWRLRKKYYLREPAYLFGKLFTVLKRKLFGMKRRVSATDYDQVNAGLVAKLKKEQEDSENG